MQIHQLANANDPVRMTQQASLLVVLYLIGVANGLVDKVVNTIGTDGFLTAFLNTFDVSVAVIAATVVGVTLTAQTPCRAMDRLDWVACAIYLLGLCVPRSFASMATLTFFALYMGIRNRHSSEATAAASLFIGIAVCQLWGKVALHLFAAPVLGADASLVAGLLGVFHGGEVEHVGNLVNVPASQSLVILPGCSSLSNISYALLCWLTVVRASRPRWLWSDLAIMPFIAVGVGILNILRMTLMGINREFYFSIHSSVGANVINSLILIIAITAARAALARNFTPA